MTNPRDFRWHAFHRSQRKRYSLQYDNKHSDEIFLNSKLNFFTCVLKIGLSSSNMYLWLCENNETRWRTVRNKSNHDSLKWRQPRLGGTKPGAGSGAIVMAESNISGFPSHSSPSPKCYNIHDAVPSICLEWIYNFSVETVKIWWHFSR